MTPHTRLLAAALALGLPLCATLPDALRAQTAIPRPAANRAPRPPCWSPTTSMSKAVTG